MYVDDKDKDLTYQDDRGTVRWTFNDMIPAPDRMREMGYDEVIIRKSWEVYWKECGVNE